MLNIEKIYAILTWFLVNGGNQMIINFFYGKDVAPEGDLENLIKKDDVATPKEEKTILQTALRLGFCASGLYVSHLIFPLDYSV